MSTPCFSDPNTLPGTVLIVVFYQIILRASAAVSSPTLGPILVVHLCKLRDTSVIAFPVIFIG